MAKTQLHATQLLNNQTMILSRLAENSAAGSSSAAAAVAESAGAEKSNTMEVDSEADRLARSLLTVTSKAPAASGG